MWNNILICFSNCFLNCEVYILKCTFHILEYSIDLISVGKGGLFFPAIITYKLDIWSADGDGVLSS